MDTRTRTNREQFEKTYALAAKVVETARKAVNKLDYSKLDYSGIPERGEVTRAFLAASLDHGRALMYLVGTMDSKYMLSSMALLRPQIETLSRGIFFGSADACTEREVRAFLDTDKLPRRSGADGSRRPMTLEQLFDVVRFEMLNVPGMGTAQNNALMKNFFRFGADQLHAPVHGGRVIVAGYLNTPLGLYMCPSFDLMLKKVTLSACCAVFAQTFMNWRVCGLPVPAPDAEAAAARAAFYADIAPRSPTLARLRGSAAG
jgi:hypothetical protein